MNDRGGSGCRFGVLGPLVLDGGRIQLRPASRRLLSILLLEPGATVGPEVLADRLWGEGAPATVGNALQGNISALRRALGAEAVQRHAGGYRIVVGADDVDVVRFARLATQATQGGGADGREAVVLAEEALRLWRGAPFAALADDVFAQPTIVRLEELHHQVREVRVRGLRATGRAREALPELEAMVLEHPHREALWRLLAMTRHDLERRVEALAALADARTALAEVGLDPGPRLQRLEAHLFRVGQTGRPSSQPVP